MLKKIKFDQLINIIDTIRFVLSEIGKEITEEHKVYILNIFSHELGFVKFTIYENEFIKKLMNKNSSTPNPIDNILSFNNYELNYIVLKVIIESIRFYDLVLEKSDWDKVKIICKPLYVNLESFESVLTITAKHECKADPEISYNIMITCLILFVFLTVCGYTFLEHKTKENIFLFFMFEVVAIYSLYNFIKILFTSSTKIIFFGSLIFILVVCITLFLVLRSHYFDEKLIDSGVIKNLMLKTLSFSLPVGFFMLKLLKYVIIRVLNKGKQELNNAS